MFTNIDIRPYPYIIHRPTTLPRSNVPLPFAKMRVVCATEMGGLVTLPSAVAIIGGGVIAVEYATVLGSNIPYQHALSTLPFNTFCQHTLSTHSSNPPYQHH